MLNDEQLGKLRREVGMGIEISALVNNQTVKEVFDGLLHGRQNEWLACMNSTEREHLWLEARGAVLFWDALQSIVNTGKFAAQQLADDQAIRKQNGQE